MLGTKYCVNPTDAVCVRARVRAAIIPGERENSRPTLNEQQAVDDYPQVCVDGLKVRNL